MNELVFQTVTCYGAGLIGCGWAACLALGGCQVSVYDASPESLDRAPAQLRKNLEELLRGGLISADKRDAALARVRFEADARAALSGAQLVIEATPERLEVKQAVLSAIDDCCGADVVVGSSSSSLLISQIACHSAWPQRCVAIHPYNPPHLIPLVELVGMPGSEAVVEQVRIFLEQLGKKPVVLKKEAKGYIANRLQVVVGREIVELVYRGICTVEDAETALTYGPGLRWAIMGHNLTMQLGGGPGGVKGMFDKVVARGAKTSSYLDDLGNWVKYPDDWPDVAQAGIDEVLAHRDRSIGDDNPTLAAYRDKMLMELLKLHRDVRLTEEEQKNA